MGFRLNSDAAFTQGVMASTGIDDDFLDDLDDLGGDFEQTPSDAPNKLADDGNTNTMASTSVPMAAGIDEGSPVVDDEMVG